MQAISFPLRTGKPEVLIDVPAVLGQFLNDLTIYDLVVELVQNELDAGSSKTIITFGEEALTCEGNGRQIDDAGWERLRYVLGAGGDVAAKVGGIGAKNHGLRSAFLLGDTITVQSAKKRIDLTVRGDEANPNRFFPAVWPIILDDTSPITGTRITVPYRRVLLEVPNGDNTSLLDETPENIALLYEETTNNSPGRFIGASSPGRKWHYELVLVFDGRTTNFIFVCEPLKGKYSGLFVRKCCIRENDNRAKTIIRELGYVYELKIEEGDHAKIPQLFKRGSRLLAEISWTVDRNNLPKSGHGAIRYPIGYPIEHVQSGLGFNISGPFISGRARHSLSDASRNKIIIRAGCAAFVAVTRKKLIPLFGARALDLVSSTRLRNAEAETNLVTDLLSGHALPILIASKKADSSTPPAGVMNDSEKPF